MRLQSGPEPAHQPAPPDFPPRIGAAHGRRGRFSPARDCPRRRGHPCPEARRGGGRDFLDLARHRAALPIAPGQEALPAQAAEAFRSFVSTRYVASAPFWIAYSRRPCAPEAGKRRACGADLAFEPSPKRPRADGNPGWPCGAARDWISIRQTVRLPLDLSAVAVGDSAAQISAGPEVETARRYRRPAAR